MTASGGEDAGRLHAQLCSLTSPSCPPLFTRARAELFHSDNEGQRIFTILMSKAVVQC